jgi:hypothetical protein
MTPRIRICCVVVLALFAAGCDARADTAGGAAAEAAATPSSTPAAGGGTAAADEFPCNLFTLREVGSLIGESELRAHPLDNTCSWLNPQRQGVELYINISVDMGMLGVHCDDSSRRTLDECGFSADDFETVSGIGREARVWLDEPDDFGTGVRAPKRWAAEALAGNDVITVFVNEPFGRDGALRVLRATVDKMAGRS